MCSRLSSFRKQGNSMIEYLSNSYLGGGGNAVGLELIDKEAAVFILAQSWVFGPFCGYTML